MLTCITTYKIISKPIVFGTVDSFLIALVSNCPTSSLRGRSEGHRYPPIGQMDALPGGKPLPAGAADYTRSFPLHPGR